MKVTVIIPCYNVENYIEKCLDSVFSQNYQDLQVIAVDNNSKDRTKRRLTDYKYEKDGNLIILSEPKKGAAAARNAGLVLADGEWIQFLDADDLLLSGKISHQISLVQENANVSFIAGAYVRKKLDGIEQNFQLQYSDPWLALPLVGLGITSANLFNRNWLKKVDGWDERLNSSQEYDLMFRLLQINDNIIFDNEPHTIVQDRPHGSITKTNVLGNNIRRLEHLCSVRDYFLRNSFEKKHLDNVSQYIFQEIRRVYKLAPKEAQKKYRELFREKPNIRSNSATSKIYVILFNFCGFRITQKINWLYQKFKSKPLKLYFFSVFMFFKRLYSE